MQLRIVRIKEIDQILGILSGPGEKARPQSRTMWILHVLQMHLIVGSLPKIGSLDQISSEIPSMILRDKQFGIQVMITLHQKNARNVKVQNLQGDVRGRNLECIFVKPHKPGFVNSKDKEERTCFFYSLPQEISLFLPLPFPVPHLLVFTHTFSIFLSVSLVLFYWPYPEGTIIQSTGSQSVVPKPSGSVSPENINSNLGHYHKHSESETPEVGP